MNTLSEYNKFTILGPPMRSYAFGERSSQNEKGVYFGLEFTPNHKFKIKGYADNYELPWLRFGVDSPAKDNDYLLQADYKISRAIKMYIRLNQRLRKKNLLNLLKLVEKEKVMFVFISITKKERIGVLQTDLKLH